MLDAVDHRIGLIDRLTAAITDTRDARYITHTLRDLLKQRVFQIASGYEDRNDADKLRDDPLFKLAAGRAPLDGNNQLACGATHSRLEGELRRSDIYRIASTLVEQFTAGYSEAPASITLDLDHTDDATHGQQELSGIRNLRLMADLISHFLSCESVLICLLLANLREAKIDTHLPDNVFIISGGFMIFKLPIAGI